MVSTGHWDTFGLWTVQVWFPRWGYAAGNAVKLSSHKTLLEKQIYGKMRHFPNWERLLGSTVLESWTHIAHPAQMFSGAAGLLGSHPYCSPGVFFCFLSLFFSEICVWLCCTVWHRFAGLFEVNDFLEEWSLYSYFIIIKFMFPYSFCVLFHGVQNSIFEGIMLINTVAKDYSRREFLCLMIRIWKVFLDFTLWVCNVIYLVCYW